MAAVTLSSISFGQAVLPSSGSPFSWSGAWDLKKNKALALVNYSVTAYPSAFGVKGLNLDGIAFGGTQVAGSATGGIGAGLQENITPNVKLLGGFGEAFYVNQKTSPIVFLTISGKF